MRLLADVFLLAGAVVIFASGVFFIRALGHSRAETRGARLMLWMQGAFAPRSAFSERGWRLRQRAFLVAAIGFVLLLVFALLELLQE